MEATLALLTNGNQNKKLELASWGLKLVQTFGSNEIRLGKDAEGKCFGFFTDFLQIMKKWLSFNNLPGLRFIFNL